MEGLICDRDLPTSVYNRIAGAQHRQKIFISPFFHYAGLLLSDTEHYSSKRRLRFKCYLCRHAWWNPMPTKATFLMPNTYDNSTEDLLKLVEKEINILQ